MDPEQQIISILRGYPDKERIDILEAVAIRLGYVCSISTDSGMDDDDDDDSDDNVAPWG